MKIFFSAGEPSGDLHGANLIRKLRRLDPKIETVGYGGPEMASAGCKLHEDLTELAVMWVQSLLNLNKFFGLLKRADRYFRQDRPDGVVLIDYPGFNWWIARRAKAKGIPVFYYSPPQIWAWGSWRVKKMRRFVDHVLCGLPFEQEWLRERGCNATFVGHPYFDQAREQQLDAHFLAECQKHQGPLVTILPGSRTQEVQHNLRWLLKAAANVHQKVPEARFAVACFKALHAQKARGMVAEMKLPIEVYQQKTPELIHLAHCCMAVSGSVSLELLYQTKPTVILYWVNRVAFFVQKLFRRVKYITLVNLLSTDELYPKDLSPYDPNQQDADRILFPEYLTCEDKSDEIASHVVEWLTDLKKYDERVAALARLKARVGHGGASRKTAEYILAHLAPRQVWTARPHFLADKRLPSATKPGAYATQDT